MATTAHKPKKIKASLVKALRDLATAIGESDREIRSFDISTFRYRDALVTEIRISARPTDAEVEEYDKATASRGWGI